MANKLDYIVRHNFKKAYEVGFFHLISVNLLIQIVGFGMQMFLSKIMTPDNLGRMKVLQSFVGIAVIISTLGLDVAITKYCSEKIDDNEKINLLATGLKITFLISGLMVLVMFALSFFKVYSTDILINKYMRVYIIIIPLLAINNICFSYLQSQKRIKSVAKVQSYSKFINIFIVVILVYIFNFYGYIIGMIMGSLISFILFLHELKDEISSALSLKVNRLAFTKLFYMGKYNLLTNGIGQLIMSTDALLINYLSNKQSELGYYSIAQLFILGLRVIPSTIQQIMIPYISEEANNIENLIYIYKNYKKKIVLLMSVLVIPCYIFIPILINLFFGAKYLNSIKYFKILLFGFYFFCLYSTNISLFIGLGKVKYNLYYGLFFEFVNLTVQYCLIKKCGIIGAAYGSSIAFILSFFFNEFITNRVLKNLK